LPAREGYSPALTSSEAKGRPAALAFQRHEIARQGHRRRYAFKAERIQSFIKVGKACFF
jgi:hypothetical protein